jgi:hypothetical protein
VHVLTVNGMRDVKVRWASKNTDAMFQRTVATGENATDSYASVLGMWYWTVAPPPAQGLGDWHQVAGGMRAGSSFAKITSPILDHRWTSKAADWQTFGMNMTEQLTTWLLPKWAAS